jgi:hypothetical protein
MKPKLMVKLKNKAGSVEGFRQWEVASGVDNAVPSGVKVEVENL